MIQKGTIKAVTEGSVTIGICQAEACAACNAKNICNAQSSNKFITIDLPDTSKYHVGDDVTVGIGKHTGKKAVLIAYVLPLILLVATLALTINLGMSQEVAAVASLVVTALYFLVLYFLKTKIKEQLKFYIIEENK